EHDLAEIGEPVERARLRDDKPLDADTTELGSSLRVFVLPADVILRARGDDGDVVTGGEPLGNRTAVPFGASGDLGSESVDHGGDLHVRKARRSKRRGLFPVPWSREPRWPSAASRFRSRAPRCTRTAAR